MPPLRGHCRRGLVARLLAVEQGEAGRAAARHADEIGARLRSQPVEHLADLRHQRDRRGLRGRCALRASRRAARGRPRPTARTPRRSTAGTRGLTSSTGVPLNPRSIGSSRSPAPSPRAGHAEAGRRARRRRAPARPRSACAGSMPHSRVKQAQRRRRVGRAAADPRGDRQLLVQMQPAPRSTPTRRAAPARRRRRLSSPRGTSPANGPLTSSDKLVGRFRGSARRHPCRRRRSSRCRDSRRRAAAARAAPG